MKKQLIILCAVALLAGCSTPKGNGGPTVFQGRIIGYNGEFVEFFLPTEGKIASVNAPRPSTPNLLDELKALL